MNEPNLTGPITRDMVNNKIDTELNGFAEGVPLAERDPHYFYVLGAYTFMRNALEKQEIPPHLLERIYSKESVNTELLDSWKAVTRGSEQGVTMDSVCGDAARRWLDGVQHEHNLDLLCDRVAAEHGAFIQEEMKKSPGELIDDAWRIACMADLRMIFEAQELDPKMAAALLTHDGPLLEQIYYEYIRSDHTASMDYLRETAETLADEQHKAITSLQMMPVTDPERRQLIYNYLQAHGGPDLAVYASLELDKRGLIFSRVELNNGSNATEFLAPDIPDRHTIGSLDEYRKFVRYAGEAGTQAEINVSVSAYRIGTSFGSQEFPNDDELRVLRLYERELGLEYNIDQFNHDSFVIPAPVQDYGDIDLEAERGEEQEP